MPPKPSVEVIVEGFPFVTEKELPTPPPNVVDYVFPQAVDSKSGTKRDIIGFRNIDTETAGDESDESIDITDIKPNVKFLPASIDVLAERFNKLSKEFMRQEKHEHRNELVFLLDELLRQDGINRDEYAQYNNMLAESLGSGLAKEIESTKDEAESTTMEDVT